MSSVADQLARAADLQRAGQWGAAEQAYRAVLAVDPREPSAHFWLATALAHQGRFDDAVASFDDAWRLQSKFDPLIGQLRATLAANFVELGLAIERQGRPAAAVNSYQKALELVNDHVPALGNLGNALKNLGRLDESADCYRRVLAVAPNSAQAHNDLGLIAGAQGRGDEAEQHFRQALAIDPQFAEAHSNLGALLTRRGQLDEAEQACRRAIELKPGYAEAHCDLGRVFLALGQLPEAVACFQCAVQLAPHLAEGYAGLSTALLSERKAIEAEPHARRAMQLNPQYSEARYNLALALAAQNKLAEAAEHYAEFLRVKPDSVAAQFSLGLVLRDLERHAEAEAAFRRVLELKPDHPHAALDLGIALFAQDRFDEAQACYLRALEITPDNAHAYNNLAVLALHRNRLEEAEAHGRRAIAADPLHGESHFTLALALLLAGKLTEGWRQYEWRSLRFDEEHPPHTQPQWIGGQLQGQTVLLRSEQGLGDTIHFTRYAELAKRQGARVVVECQPQLAQLVATAAGVDRVVPCGQPLGEFDAFAPLMSLGDIFSTSLETIPAGVPYLTPDPARVDSWRQELGGIAGYKVGIAWQGSPTNRRDRQRSMRLAEFAPLAALEGVRLYSLQLGAGREQLAEFIERWPVVDLGDRLGDFYNTAAIVKCLDLVITCDSATAHLAGALGVPVWVALPFSPDWRWLLERDDSPWYPTMRLFRQREPGRWDEVFQRISEALAARL